MCIVQVRSLPESIQLQACTNFPVKYKKLDWNIDDPGEIPGTDEDRLKAFRETRDLLFNLIAEQFK